MYRLDFFFEDNSDIATNSNDLDTTSNRLERPVLSGVTPSYVVDHSPSVGQARHFRSWPTEGELTELALLRRLTTLRPDKHTCIGPSLVRLRYI